MSLTAGVAPSKQLWVSMDEKTGTMEPKSAHCHADTTIYYHTRTERAYRVICFRHARPTFLVVKTEFSHECGQNNSKIQISEFLTNAPVTSGPEG